MNRQLAKRVRDRGEIAAMTRDEQLGGALRKFQLETASETLRILWKLIIERAQTIHQNADALGGATNLRRRGILVIHDHEMVRRTRLDHRADQTCVTTARLLLRWLVAGRAFIA